jgi:hypothetical protein
MTKKDENEIKVVKINIISKNVEIINSFLKNINATLLNLEFAVLLFEDKRFQFWLSNELDEKRSSVLNGSDTIVYFYNDKEIDEKELILLKKKLKSIRRGFVQKTPLIFIGHDSNINKNLNLIKNHFDSFNSMYVNVDDQKTMLKIFYFIVSMNKI